MNVDDDPMLPRLLRYDRGESWFEVFDLGWIGAETDEVLYAVMRALGCNPLRTGALIEVPTTGELKGTHGRWLKVRYSAFGIDLGRNSSSWNARIYRLRSELP